MTGNGDEISLSEIMADEPQGSETTQEQQVETMAETAEAGQARDDKGRFAAKTDEVETAATEQTVEKTGTVPQQALHAAREKEREARTENESLKRALDEMRGQINLLSQQRQAPQAKQEEKKAPEFWEDPDQFVSAKVSTVEQKLATQLETISKRFAIKEHGKDTVDAAYQALGTALQQGDRSAHEAWRVIQQSDDPYEEIVQWDKRAKTMQRVGSDPDAWLEAELEKRLSDPTHQAKILERLQGVAAVNTNRSDPITKLPPSLSRIPSGGNTVDDGDVSDAALFRHARR